MCFRKLTKRFTKILRRILEIKRVFKVGGIFTNIMCSIYVSCGEDGGLTSRSSVNEDEDPGPDRISVSGASPTLHLHQPVHLINLDFI